MKYNEIMSINYIDRELDALLDYLNNKINVEIMRFYTFNRIFWGGKATVK